LSTSSGFHHEAENKAHRTQEQLKSREEACEQVFGHLRKFCPHHRFSFVWENFRTEATRKNGLRGAWGKGGRISVKSHFFLKSKNLGNFAKLLKSEKLNKTLLVYF
jgi:hypothetical protein